MDYKVGDEVEVIHPVGESASGDHPEMVYACPGEKLIIRRTCDRNMYPISVSHAHRDWEKDKSCFGVNVEEIRKWK